MSKCINIRFFFLQIKYVYDIVLLYTRFRDISALYYMRVLFFSNKPDEYYRYITFEAKKIKTFNKNVVGIVTV